jgi:antitoxin HigA-1
MKNQLMKISKYRSPAHPGEMLLKEFLEPMQINQQALALELAYPNNEETNW